MARKINSRFLPQGLTYDGNNIWTYTIEIRPTDNAYGWTVDDVTAGFKMITFNVTDYNRWNADSIESVDSTANLCTMKVSFDDDGTIPVGGPGWGTGIILEPVISDTEISYVTFPSDLAIGEGYTNYADNKNHHSIENRDDTLEALIDGVSDATGVATLTSGFNAVLSSADETVQKALDTIDDHDHAHTITLDSTAITNLTSNFNDVLSDSDDTVQKALETLDDHDHPHTEYLDATAIATITSNFNDILSGTEDDVQKALDTLDDHTHPAQHAYDAIVDSTGGADYTTLNDAVSDGHTKLFIKSGDYTLTADGPIFNTPANIILMGQGTVNVDTNSYDLFRCNNTGIGVTTFNWTTVVWDPSTFRITFDQSLTTFTNLAIGDYLILGGPSDNDNSLGKYRITALDDATSATWIEILTGLPFNDTNLATLKMSRIPSQSEMYNVHIENININNESGGALIYTGHSEVYNNFIYRNVIVYGIIDQIFFDYWDYAENGIIESCKFTAVSTNDGDIYLNSTTRVYNTEFYNVRIYSDEWMANYYEGCKFFGCYSDSQTWLETIGAINTSITDWHVPIISFYDCEFSGIPDNNEGFIGNNFNNVVDPLITFKGSTGTMFSPNGTAFDVDTFDGAYKNNKAYDAIIAADGSGDYTDLKVAFDAGSRNMFVRNGTYTLTPSSSAAPTFDMSYGDNLQLTGESRDGVIFECANVDGEIFSLENAGSYTTSWWQSLTSPYMDITTNKLFFTDVSSLSTGEFLTINQIEVTDVGYFKIVSIDTTANTVILDESLPFKSNISHGQSWKRDVDSSEQCGLSLKNITFHSAVGVAIEPVFDIDDEFHTFYRKNCKFDGLFNEYNLFYDSPVFIKGAVVKIVDCEFVNYENTTRVQCYIHSLYENCKFLGYVHEWSYGSNYINCHFSNLVKFENPFLATNISDHLKDDVCLFRYNNCKFDDIITGSAAQWLWSDLSGSTGTINGRAVSSYSHFGNRSKAYDAIIDINGNGDFTDFKTAFTSGARNMFVRNGTYTISPTSVPDMQLAAGDKLSITGESRDGVILNFPAGATANWIKGHSAQQTTRGSNTTAPHMDIATRTFYLVDASELNVDDHVTLTYSESHGEKYGYMAIEAVDTTANTIVVDVMPFTSNSTGFNHVRTDPVKSEQYGLTLKNLSFIDTGCDKEILYTAGYFHTHEIINCVIDGYFNGYSFFYDAPYATEGWICKIEDTMIRNLTASENEIYMSGNYYNCHFIGKIVLYRYNADYYGCFFDKDVELQITSAGNQVDNRVKDRAFVDVVNCIFSDTTLDYEDNIDGVNTTGSSGQLGGRDIQEYETWNNPNAVWEVTNATDLLAAVNTQQHRHIKLSPNTTYSISTYLEPFDNLEITSDALNELDYPKIIFTSSNSGFLYDASYNLDSSPVTTDFPAGVTDATSSTLTFTQGDILEADHIYNDTDRPTGDIDIYPNDINTHPTSGSVGRIKPFLYDCTLTGLYQIPKINVRENIKFSRFNISANTSNAQLFRGQGIKNISFENMIFEMARTGNNVYLTICIDVKMKDCKIYHNTVNNNLYLYYIDGITLENLHILPDQSGLGSGNIGVEISGINVRVDGVYQQMDSGGDCTIINSASAIMENVVGGRQQFFYETANCYANNISGEEWTIGYAVNTHASNITNYNPTNNVGITSNTVNSSINGWTIIGTPPDVFGANTNTVNTALYNVSYLEKAFIVTGNTTISTAFKNILVDATAAPTLTLNSNFLKMNAIITIKDISGNAATNNITIATEGSETIDGQSSILITTNYASVTLCHNGTDWFIK